MIQYYILGSERSWRGYDSEIIFETFMGQWITVLRPPREYDVTAVSEPIMIKKGIF